MAQRTRRGDIAATQSQDVALPAPPPHADANFPAASVAAHTPGGLINCDGVDAATLLRAVMALLPLDPTCPPCSVMALMPEHKAAGWKTPIWDTYKAIVCEAEGRDVPFVEVERGRNSIACDICPGASAGGRAAHPP